MGQFRDQGQNRGFPERPTSRRTQLPVVQGRGQAVTKTARASGQAAKVVGACTRFLVRLLIPVALLLTLAVGIGYFRLLQGPVSLKLLVDPVQRGISQELAHLRPVFDDVVVALTRGGGLEFRLQNLKIFEPDGAVVLAAPAAGLQLSGRAFWSMNIVPARVELIEPRVFLSYSKDDGIELRLSPDQSQPLKPPTPLAAGSSQSPDRAQSDDPARAALSEGVTSPGAYTQQIDIQKLINQVSAQSDAAGMTSRYLREFGVRDATFVLVHEGRTSVWSVPRFVVDFDRGRASSIVSGSARVASDRGPWTMSFHAEKNKRDDALNLKVSLRDLVPETIARALPQFGLLKPIGAPVAGEASLKISASGQLENANVSFSVAKGQIELPVFATEPLFVDSGELTLAYDASSRRVVVKPSTLRWGGSSLTIAGLVVGEDRAGERSNNVWRYDLRGEEGLIAAAEFGISPLPIDKWIATGVLVADKSILQLDSFTMAAGGGEVTMSGEFDANTEYWSARLDGNLGAMPSTTLKAFWPRSLAGGGRNWVGQHVLQGQVASGSLKWLSGRYLQDTQPGYESNGQRLALVMESHDTVMRPTPELPIIYVPRTLIRLENNVLEVAMPKAEMLLESGQRLGLKAGRLTAVNIDQDSAVGEVAFRVVDGVGNVREFIETAPLLRGQPTVIPIDDVEGKISGDFKVSFPFVDDVQKSDVRFEGKARLSDGRAKKVLGGKDVQGATIDFDVTEKSLDARGDLLIAGVLAKLNYQRIFAAANNRQPPVRLTARLDNSDRKQLGLQMDQTVSGEVPVELTIYPAEVDEKGMHLRADLTNAELVLGGVAWRKPPGRTAFLEASIVPLGKGRSELRDVKVAGDNIAIEGRVELDKSSRALAFEFPTFSLNVVTRLSVKGQRKKGNVWGVTARGPTYDGRAFFRSLFSLGHIARKDGSNDEKSTDVDLDAKIDTVIGFSDVSLRGLKFKVSKRSGKLSALDARGTLDGGAPLAVVYEKKNGQPRKLLADSTDAGQLFKLVGFYPNIERGRARLEVNLDGRGAAEKTGILWTENFRILGDPIVSEVVGSGVGSPAGKRTGKKKSKPVRQVFDFDRMRAPFSVGHGQFVLQDAYMRGPLLGASLRGKVDYNQQVLNLGGTYVPLQGLNNAFGNIPLLGDLLSGPRGEGIFGITFAIQGRMANPQVIVNPLSIVTPGILREIFQLTPYDPRVSPRQGQKRQGSTNAAARASSVPAIGTPPGPSGQQLSGGAEGWAAQAQ